ncbi:arylsulfatase A-like [Sycon ciliatum]|uniref:arylsulfatase A-like n=1 Tax=Sycon ciliatum TaxID=27933 RepID=UPI0020AA4799|eukprot:scpid54320/ scgid11428/ Arylsulfatase A; Cerebroside-sulfatase
MVRLSSTGTAAEAGKASAARCVLLFLSCTAICFAHLASAAEAAKALPEKPNIIVIYGDDVGYGDLNVYGHPTSRTPNLDRMAEEGMRITSFYSAAPVCSPSRASLMTGRLFPRTGVYSSNNTKSATGSMTFTSSSNTGMLLNEITLPQQLGKCGYVSGMVGKWHLGVTEPYLPINRGFDSYFGCPLTPIGCNSTAYNKSATTGSCMLFVNHTITEQPTDIRNIDVRYVENTLNFISTNQHRPFFFYFSSHHTHMPQFASDTYLNTTQRGLFGDSLAELDYSVGAILDHVTQLGIANRTLVIFSADNGPALISQQLGGEQGPLKCGKGTTYEGGVREPGIFWWPGVIAAGRLSYALASTMDIFPTAVSLAGGQLPADRAMDGLDITKLLTGESAGPRYYNIYYSGHVLMAVRLHQHKAHFFTMGSHCLPTYPDKDCHNNASLEYHDPPLLFDVNQDPKERYPLDTKLHKVPLQKMQALLAEHNKTMTFGPAQCDQGNDPKKNFPCCSPECTPRPSCCKCPTAKHIPGLHTTARRSHVAAAAGQDDLDSMRILI